MEGRRHFPVLAVVGVEAGEGALHPLVEAEQGGPVRVFAYEVVYGGAVYFAEASVGS